VPCDVDDLAGLEVDSVFDRYGYMETVVTGRVMEIKSHPDADRLQICDVKIGEMTMIGTGASVIPGITIGKNCIIGAGTVVIKDVDDNSTIVGNPGRVVE
jgi:acetyltransferase-like isoleucine patch superfamily enzyme